MDHLSTLNTPGVSTLTVQRRSSSFNPQIARTNSAQTSLDSNGNEPEFLPQRNESVMPKGSPNFLRQAKNSQQSAPLTLGGFARTLLKKANEENVSNDNEFALSPNSVRKLMFFPPRANQKAKLHLPNRAVETCKENVSPPTSLLVESKDSYAETTNEVSIAGKSMCKTEEDSGIVNSLLSITEALDLCVGSTSRRNSHLQSIQETTESPDAPPKYKRLDHNDSPRKMESLKPSKSEGCISIKNVGKESSVAYKPSPPLRAEGNLQPAIPIKGALLIPGNPVAVAGLSKCRKSTSDLGVVEVKSQVKPKRLEKCSSLRGTPKGFNAAKLRERNDAHQSNDITRNQAKNELSPMMDWNLEAEGVQGKKYLVIKQLGKGASGEVSLVIESQTKGLYALKKVNLAGINESVIQECINEIQMLVELKDTDLVIRIQAWEINKMQQTMKIVMEYGQCDLGSSLRDSTYSLQQVRATWESMLKIVSKIHERGIVHSDLKPANFVWVGNHLKIIDFGIASRLQNDNTSISMLNPKGTLNYISPETIRPDVTGRTKIGPKSDIWALGCILFLMVYGKTPFHDHVHYMSKMNAILNGAIIYPPLPPAFEGTGVDSVLRMCFKMDHRRRPTAAELLDSPFLPGPKRKSYEPSDVFKKPFLN